MKCTTSALIVTTLLGSATLAQAGITDSKLAKSIPDDAFAAKIRIPIAEDDFAEAHWNHVWQTFEDSGILEEGFKTLLADASTTETEQVRAAVDKTTTLIKGVDWAGLTSKGCVTAARFDPSNPLALMSPIAPPDFVFGAEGTNGAKNVQALKSIFTEIQGLAPENFVLTETVISGFNTTTLNMQGLFTFNIAAKDDTVFLSFGQGLLNDVIQGYSGTTTKKSLFASDRFVDAAKGLDEAERQVSYTDFKAMYDVFEPGFGKVITMAMSNNEAPPEKVETAEKILALVFRELRAYDRKAEAEHVDGLSIVTESRLTFGDKASESLIYNSTCGGDRSLGNWMNAVPAKALNYGAFRGFDLGKFYNGLIKEVEAFPEAAEGVKQWKAVLAEKNIDLDRDLFSWLSGETIFYALPGGGMGSQETGFLIKVKDDAKATEAINKTMTAVNAALAGENQPQIAIRPAKLAGTEFNVYTHPQAAMFFRPVIGVKNGWLYVGTSESTVAKSIEASGDASKSLASVDGPLKAYANDKDVVSVGYNSMANLGQELAASFAIAAFSGAMAASSPDTPPQVKGMFQLLARIGPTLQQINFLEGSTTITKKEGNSLKTVTIMTYKDVPVPTPTPAAEEKK